MAETMFHCTNSLGGTLWLEAEDDYYSGPFIKVVSTSSGPPQTAILDREDAARLVSVLTQWLADRETP